MAVLLTLFCIVLLAMLLLLIADYFNPPIEKWDVERIAKYSRDFHLPPNDDKWYRALAGLSIEA